MGEDKKKPLCFARIVEMFASMAVMTMLAHLLAAAPTSHMRLVLLPSCSDVVLPSVFPQPPMAEDALRGIPDAVKHRITVVSNPGTFSMGGVVFGAVSEDILMHMAGDSAQHLPSLPSTGRIPRLAQHLLDQRSYYPLFPAPPTVPLDLAQMGHLDLPVTPDVLLVPSCLKPFAQVRSLCSEYKISSPVCVSSEA